jgi:hypothetical protein
MLAATSPLLPLFQGAVEASNRILITHEFELVRLSGRLPKTLAQEPMLI